MSKQAVRAFLIMGGVTLMILGHGEGLIMLWIVGGLMLGAGLAMLPA